MALRRENYTQMGICILVYVFSILSLSAQNQVCPIWADLEPNADQRTATPTIYSQSVSVPFYDWEQLDSSRHSDDQYATVVLPGILRSEMSTYSKWGHKIPDGASIQGIKLSIEGHQTGNGKIRDVKVQLQGSDENKAGQYLGVAFPDSIDQVWRYGGANDTWGRNWTSDQINSSSFGLIYQVRNSLSSEATLHIDQITIEIFFTPMYSFCNDGHACVAFGVEEIPGYNYNWDIPLGFERLSSLNEQYTVNIGATAATDFGQYDLCVDVFDQNGNFAENCCRQFIYKDCRPVTIGDLVFLDNDHDNQFSDGDTGVSGVVIYLYDEFQNEIATTVTDETGKYEFVETQDNYYVQIELPDGFLPIDANIGGDDTDSDLDGSNGPLTTSIFFAAAGTIIDNVDIGLATELIIGDKVWEDKNYNGIQDSLELGIANIEVQLIAANGDTLQTTVTDDNGSYGFDGIRVDDYEVRFIAADGYWATLQNVGTEDLDSDIDEDGSTGVIDFDVLGMPYFDLDAGFYRYASVGDFVFNDLNENGIQDITDEGQDSVLVTLSTAAGVVIGSVLTDESGVYLFDSLTPGEYVITVEASELIKPTLSQQGTDPSADSDLLDDNGTYSTGVFTLMSNEVNKDIDLGWRDNLADLSGLVFEDIKYDGQYDSQDILLTDVTVQLLSQDGTVVQSITTGIDGAYLFMDILPGEYYITFNAGNDYLFTQANIGDDALDSDVTQSVTSGSTDLVMISVGQEIININAGVYRTTSIGDYVFLDLNEDGIQDGNDTGLAGIALSLLDVSGNEISNVTTEEDGAYTFSDLVPGIYTILLSSPDLYLASIPGEGTDATDSDLININGQYSSSEILTCSGQEIDTIDFGFVHNYAVVTGQIFEDSKADSNYDALDTLIASVPVSLYDINGVLIQSETTDTLGQYMFADILAGDYYIVYGLSGNYNYTTNDVTGANGVGSTDNFTVTAGQIIDDLITGAYISASVGDYVFLDLNEDGIQNSGDVGLGGITVELQKGNGDLVSTVESSADGSYMFADILPGLYVIVVEQDERYLPTLANVGDAETDSDLIEVNDFYTPGVVILCSGQEVDTIDLGFVHNYAQINGQVYEDNKADAMFNVGDTAIVNVAVTLYNSLGEEIQSTVTDISGNFIFDDVLAGEYYVHYGLGSEYIYSTANVTGNNGVGSTNVFILTPGEIKNDENTGAYILGSIGDYVFLDNDEDGIQGSGDSGLSAVELDLLDASGSVVQSTVSDDNGSYIFDGLIPGVYTIALTNSELYLATLSNIGDDELDSDLLGDAGDYLSPEITICSGETNQTLDFGYIIDYATVSGQVYEDSKADALFNTGDTAIVNVVVTLYNALGEEIQSTVTDTLGNFIFDDILAGDYYVQYGLDNEYIYSTANVTGNNGVGSTDVFVLAPGEIKEDEITGAYILGSIGDYVFLDNNEDGIQGVGDSGLSAVELDLLDASGSVVQSTVSDDDGSYSFNGLVPGVYTISLANSEFYLATSSNVGDDELDSDLLGDAGDYLSPEITICSGQTDHSIDFGFVIDYATITGQVYEDSKADKVFNAPDTSLVAVPVTLYNTANEIVQTTTTNVDGNFAFENVFPGDYYIVYDLGSEYIYSTDNVTGTFGIGSTNIISLAPGELNNDESTGAYVFATIGDYVFLDLDEDGLQGVGDIGLEGVVLTLVNGSGDVVGMITTAEDGAYSFENLVPGDYIISLVASDLYLPTLFTAGDTSLDSNLETLMGNYGSGLITVCSGQNEESIDFGFVNNYASIRGQVYEDSKADSIFNDIDTLIANVTVTLYRNDNTIAQETTTDVSGNFVFENVIGGDYYIVYSLGASYIYTSAEVTGANGAGSTNDFTLPPGESRIENPIGAYRLGSIGDYVFLDLNENGIQDDTDLGLGGILLELFNSEGQLVQSTNSEADGSYSFNDLVPGQYSIFVTTTDLYLATLPYEGEENLDSDLLFGSGLLATNVIVICSGENNISIDLGFVNNYAEITGSFFEDSKANRIFDEPDTLIAEVQVSLYHINGTLIASTLTTTDGSYLFEDVLAGDYYIVFGLPADYIYSTVDVSGNNGAGSTDNFTLLPGESVVYDPTGAYLNVSIGDYVFLDQDDDGIQSINDVGLADVQLTLYDDQGISQGVLTTDESGVYTFDNLTPGKYIIQAEFNDLYIPTGYQIGDENLDSDLQKLNDVYLSDTITICSGENFDDIDFGLANNYAQIGGIVFTDMMRDGQYMSTDELLEGIPVILYDVDGTEIATTTSMADGTYLFDKVLTGDYYVVFDLGNRLTTLEDEGDDATDSDVTGDNGVGSTATITLAPGESNLTVFAGVYELSSIGDFVWSDDNRNGLQDAGEPGIENVVVNLYDNANLLVSKDTTDVDGIYGFAELIPGIYYIEVEYPQDLTATINTMVDLALNSDLTEGNGLGTTDLITLSSGINNLDVDAGLALAGAEIHGEVWVDLDGNETQSVGDTLLPGVPVMLFNADSNLEVFSTVTNQNGTYSFKPLDDGSYYVQFGITDTLVYVTPGVGLEGEDSDVDDTNGTGTTADITVVVGDVIWDIDAGIEDGRSEISGLVFVDKNGDGINEDSEINLDTYIVNLHQLDGTIVKSVMSNLDGTYAMVQVATGDYYLTFTMAEDYRFTAADTAGDDTIDSDVTSSQVVGSTDVFTLGIQDSQVYDAGVYLLGSIGDFVWFDTDGNGLQDMGEPGVELVNLTILNMAGEAVDIVNTGEDGAYLFSGLIPGRYWIFVQAPLDLKATTYQVGTDGDLDSDLVTDGVFLLSDTIMIMSGQDDLSIDFGLVENPGSIEGVVWNDINLDGVFNDELTVFDAVTVELYSSDGLFMATTVSDSDGAYIFNNVSPNDYYVKFSLNDGSTFTDADQNGDDDIDSDVTSGGNGEGTTETFTLSAGQSITNIYAGLIFPAKIGDLVFLDQNSNGLQDLGEPGIPMIKVILYNESGVKLDSVITDVQGLYSFVDLDPASYYLEFVYPDAIQPTISIATMPTLNSDITAANGLGTTDLIFLGSGVCNEDIDGGFVPSGAVIIGEVWLDTDGNDIQDNPNNPVEGISVSLYRTGGVLVAGPVLTNELGIYGFSSIPTGSYYVSFDIPDTLDFVNPHIGPVDTDSDVTHLMAAGSTDPFIVLNGELYDNIDAGVKDIRSTIQGQLFIDSDADGMKDINNEGLEGVDVKLYDISGSEVANTVTTTNGSYIFENLLANSYYVEFSNYSSTYLFTEANVGDDSVDSDIVNVNNGMGSSASFILTLDQVISVDGGMYELASVGNYTWIDENNDGVQDPSELPLAGIRVEAKDASQTVFGTSISDADGMYLIEDLVPGTYNLIFTNVENYIPTIANLGGDDTTDSDINSINSQQAATGTFDLVSGESNLDFDGGYVFAQPSDGVISGLAWIDSDGNGIREGSNPRIQDLGVVLYNDLNVEQANTTTNANGEYTFTQLADGNYYVLFQNEIGTSPTLPNIGSDLTDSDITKAFGGSTTDIINLGPSEVIENVDGGFVSVGAIGNQIFVDVNGNGRKGSNEPGLNGVTVKLYDSNTNVLLKTTTSTSSIATMEDGFYQFNDVQLGSYYVVFELPEPYLFTEPNSGSNEGLDSDVTGASNGFVGSTDVFSLASGEVKDDIDAGVFLPAQIGDFVWDDLNANGIQDPGEPGIPNIAVELKRSNGASVASTITDANGNYCFDGLKQGLYFIEFEVPAGYVVSDIYQGDSSMDSDVDATGTTPLVSIAHGSSFKEVDAGFNSQTNNNLVSHVWFDEDADGIYQVNETTVKDVVISLIDDQGTVMAQTTTNHAGKYAFVNISLGDYQVGVGIDDGFATTAMNAGNDDWIDSDVDNNGMSAMFTVNDGLSVPNIDIGLVEDDGKPEMGEESEQTGEVEFKEELDQKESPISFVSGPNPFYNRVQIRMSRLVDGVAYSIFRLDGALIQSGAIVDKNQWIELEQHNDGMYILVVTHNGKPVDKQYLMKVN